MNNTEVSEAAVSIGLIVQLDTVQFEPALVDDDERDGIRNRPPSYGATFSGLVEE